MHVVALHAYPVDRRLFQPVIRACEEGRLGTGVTVFAPDFRGRGTSRHAAADVHSMELLADDVAHDIADLVPLAERFVLMGVSMGGYVVLELLRRHRARFGARLAGVALLDTRAGADSDEGRTARDRAIAGLESEGMEAPLRHMLPNLLAPRSRGTAAEDSVVAMIRATPPATAIADQKGMRDRADRFDVLAALDVPLLVAVGEEDTVTPESEAEAMAEVASRAPFVRLLTIPEAGHLSILERPDDVAGALRDLVARST
jgi:pimeloyl-ACP methyl ester carboxylesterase